MLLNGYVPNNFTIVPMQKCIKLNLKCSENYRPIAISSLLGKAFDNINHFQQQFGVYKSFHTCNMEK